MRKNTLTRKTIISMLIVSLIFGVSFAAQTDTASAATKKPGKVKIKSCTSTATTVTLKWKKVKGAKGYQIYRASKYPPKKNFKRIKTVKKNKLSFTDKGLGAYTSHVYKVRAYKLKKGKKIYGKFSSWMYADTKEYEAPQKVSLTAKAISDSEISLSWTKAANADGYQVQKVGEEGIYGTPIKLSTVRGSDSTSYTDSGLEAYSHYGYRVRAFRKAGGETVYGKFTGWIWDYTLGESAKYSYEVFFLNPPYAWEDSPCTDVNDNTVYVKTDNPNGSFELGGDSCGTGIFGGPIKLGGGSSRLFGPTDYIDLAALTKNAKIADHTNWYKVKGGYMGSFKFEKPGFNEIRVREFHLRGDGSIRSYVGPEGGLALKANVYVRDGGKECEAWAQSVIDKVTTKDMTGKEKMQAIADYLKSSSTYPVNVPTSKYPDGEFFELAREFGTPFFLKNPMRLDSAASPWLLKYFSQKIGYPVKTVNYANEDEWKRWHAYVESVEDGTRFTCCNQMSTGRIDPEKVQQITLDEFVSAEHFSQPPDNDQ